MAICLERGADCLRNGPADATAIPKPRHQLPHLNPDWFFYRAMLCIRGTSHGPVSVRLSVCLSVRRSQVGVLLKRQNTGSHKQHHTIAQGL